jgi:type VI protein secretion system component Hcp
MMRVGFGISVMVVAIHAASVAYAEQSITFDMDSLQRRVQIHGFTTSTTNPGGKANCGEIHLTKPLDAASPLLIAHVFTGRVSANALIRVSADGKRLYDLALQDVTVASVQQSHLVTTGTELVEVVALRAVKYSFNFFSPKSKFGWDCAANKQL